MTQISDYDIATVENEIEPDARYKAERSKQSFDMYLKGKDYREVMTEELTAKLIAKQLGLSNEQVKKTTHSAPHDVEFRVKDSRYARGYKIVRVEVKSALCDKTLFEKHERCYYRYVAVKPNNFDYIFFYEVNPYDGLVVKWTTRKEIFDFVRLKTEYEKGYQIAIKDLTNSDKIKLYDIEDFPPEK